MMTERSDTASTADAVDDSQSGPIFLVVDDDAMVRKVVARGLAELDPAEVLEVEDGIAAQQVLRERRVDVVVTDVLMPNMNGLELMKWAQDNCPEPLWIVLSGVETFDSAVDALQLGAFDYLAKPPEVQRVRVAVRNALDQIELVRERKRLYQQIEHSNAQLAEKVDQLEKLCRLLQEQAAVIQADLARAEIIQHALLPQEPPDIDGWCLETLYCSGSRVGGDFYDVIALDEHHVGLVIADASGHGVAAAMLAVLFKLGLNLTDDDGKVLMPKQVMGDLNRELHQTISAPGAFITAAYLLLDHRTGMTRIASAGHPPGIWTGKSGAPQLLERTGPALGLSADARYEEHYIHLDIDDQLLLYTDGVLAGGVKAPTVDDLGQALCSGTDPADLLSGLYREATRGITGERDDITMILLKRHGGASHFDIKATPRLQPAQPPPAQAELRQGVQGDRAFISIAGAATWMSSQDFLDTAGTLLEKYHKLTIDLGDCENLDSTFLGTLHEVTTAQPGAVQLQRLPGSIRKLFDELSMDAVLSHETPEIEPLPEGMQPLQQADIDATRQGARMLSAHETLASLSPENRELFRGVVDSLRADLNRKAQ